MNENKCAKCAACYAERFPVSAYVYLRCAEKNTDAPGTGCGNFEESEQ